MKAGTAREVIDYIVWMEHCEWVRSLCDSTETANWPNALNTAIFAEVEAT